MSAIIEVDTAGCNTNVAINNAIGQSFRLPYRTALRSLDLWIKPNLYYTTSYEVGIYDGEGTAGRLLATSARVNLVSRTAGAPAGWRRFEYDKTLMLEPDRAYTLELTRLSTTSGAFSNCGNKYADGHEYWLGYSSMPYNDISFRLYGDVCDPVQVLRGEAAPCPDVLLWLDVDAHDTLMADSGGLATDKEEVSSWLDGSLHENHAVSFVESRRPTLESQGLDGMRAVRFESDFMEIRDLDLRPSVLPELTSFAVYRRRGGHDEIWVARQNGFTKRTHVPSGSGLNVTTISSLILEQDPSGGRRRHWLDGDLNADQPTSFAEGEAGIALGALLHGRVGKAHYFANYDLAELVLFSRALSESEREAVEAHLVNKRCYPPPAPQGLRLEPGFGSEETLEVRTNGIWAIWWDPLVLVDDVPVDHASDAELLFARLNDVRCRSIKELGMRDPPNPSQEGVFYNIYIHHDDKDMLGFRGVFQGQDRFGSPYLAFGDPYQRDEGYINHEGFHVFQYSRNSEGFAYRGDSLWYTEASAQWYDAWRRPTASDAFLEVGVIESNPHLTLWHSSDFGGPDESERDWLFGTHRYGMHAFLYYLTEVAGAAPTVLTNGFYAGSDLLPQEYLYEQIGGEQLGRYFGDWAAHTTADFDYLVPEQVEEAREEVADLAVIGSVHPYNIRPYAAEYVDGDTSGTWARPPDGLLPRGWSYSVVRIHNSEEARYSFWVLGDAYGSAGDRSRFEARIVVMKPSGPAYTKVNLEAGVYGSASVDVTAAVGEVYLVVASVPESFTGDQTYGYDYLILRR